MYVMGTNTWENQMPKKALIFQALKFADEVKAQGIAELQQAWLNYEQRQIWCTWQTNNFNCAGS